MIKKSAKTLKPLVTIAIPVFRGARYIRMAIDSVLAQTFKDFELLIVDNCSDDETVSIVFSYSDPRIVLIRNKENIGAVLNWNKCLTLAKGRYIKILPHDDVLEPTCLEEQVKVLNDDLKERIALVFCARRIIDADGKQVIARRLFGISRGVIVSQELIRKCIRYGTNFIGEPGAVLFRLRDAKEVGWFNGQIPYVIDLDYWIRLLSKGDGYFIDKFLCSFRVSPGSWSVEIGAKQSEEFVSFIRRVAKIQVNQISNTDKVIGRIAANLNMLARRIFYWLLIR